MSEQDPFAHLRDLFFEEAYEGIAVMETALVAFDQSGLDGETLNAIFRAAHSIKGAAGGFGFTDITDFTHVMESLLDEMRAGMRAADAEVVDVLLKSVDQVRALVEAAAGTGQADLETSKRLMDRLEALSAKGGGQKSVPAEALHASRVLGISFRPHLDLLKAGNEPVAILRELAALGTLVARPNAKALPHFADLDPQQLYLSWELTLDTEAPVDKITAAFEWAEDHCDFTISTLTELWEDEPEAPPAPEPPEPRTETKPETEARARPSASIRVGIDKVDALMDIVGELVITQSMLCQLEKDFSLERLGQLRDGLGELTRQTRELQESVMRVRMVAISTVFSRFPRVVRDVKTTLGKKVELRLLGEATEVDKTVSEQLADPLTHLVRNALDHGLEGPEDRVAAGKEETGSLTLSARHEGGNIVIDIIDDGRGIDAERVLEKARSKGMVGLDERPPDEKIYDLLFKPGFSTAESVSALSGRGVGLDVVARNIRNLGGSIITTSRPGHGTTFSIHIPMTLSILDAQLVRMADQVFIVPLLSIVESVLVKPTDIGQMAGQQEVFRLREQYISVIRSAQVLGIETQASASEPRLLVVLEDQGKRVGMLVDELLDQQQVVIKSLETNYEPVAGLSGATILGDGRVAFIIDVAGFMRLAVDHAVASPTPRQPGPPMGRGHFQL